MLSPFAATETPRSDKETQTHLENPNMRTSFSWILLSLVTFSSVKGSPGTVCPGGQTPKILSEKSIGRNQDVTVQFATCSQATPVMPRSSLVTRQTNTTNVCGATCTTNCFLPSGGGPDPNECHVIADALLYDSQNIGALFNIGTGTNNTVIMTYRSCTTFFVNQGAGNLTYCRTDWSAVLDYVAFNCQSTQNAHGGNCVATDQLWFIQAQHS